MDFVVGLALGLVLILGLHCLTYGTEGMANLEEYSLQFPPEGDQNLWADAVASTVRYPGDMPANNTTLCNSGQPPNHSACAPIDITSTNRWTIPYTHWPDSTSPGGFGFGGVAGIFTGFVDPRYPPSSIVSVPKYREPL